MALDARRADRSGEARSIVEENLADEVGDDHPGLWLAFAESLGVDADAVRGATVEDETASCVGAFTDAAENNSVPFALGMLYGYESRPPGRSDQDRRAKEALWDPGPGVRYSELHGELDIEHSAEMARAIDEVCSGEEDLAEATAGARAGRRRSGDCSTESPTYVRSPDRRFLGALNAPSQ